MPDPIRSALHVAALATMTASEREHSETCHNGEPGPGHVKRAAETVAAFLREMPDLWMLQGHGQLSMPGCLGGGTVHALAAAVERAARDE